MELYQLYVKIWQRKYEEEHHKHGCSSKARHYLHMMRETQKRIRQYQEAIA